MLILFLTIFRCSHGYPYGKHKLKINTVNEKSHNRKQLQQC